MRLASGSADDQGLIAVMTFGIASKTMKQNRPAARASAQVAGVSLWFIGLIVLLALLPLPFGSNRPWASDLMAVVTGGLLLVMLFYPAPPLIWNDGKAPTVRLRMAVAAFASVIAWSFIQIMPLTPTAWHHPVWGEAAKALGPLSGSLSLDVGSFPEALLRLLSYAGCFALAFNGAREKTGAKLLLRTLAGVGGCYALYGLIVYSSGTETILWFDKWAYFGFLTSTFVNKNSYAAYAGLGLLCSLGLCWQTLRHITIKDHVLAHRSKAAAFFAALEARHYALMILPVLILAALVLTGSRAGIASTLVGVFVFFFALAVSKRMGWRKWLAGLVVLFLLLLGLVALGGDSLTGRMDTQHLDLATGERVAAYKLEMLAIGDNPWFGFGLGSFDSAFRLYRDSSLPVWFHHAHNDYIEMIMDLGIPMALVLFAVIGLLASCCMQGVWTRKRGVLYPALALGATALLATHAFVDFSFHIPAIAATYAALLGLGVAQSWSTRKA